MRHKVLYCLLVTFFLFGFVFRAPKIFAEDYVLPYPGFMPGHPLYTISQIYDTIEAWWSFGSFAKFKYHLSMADKKLVEVQTLFSYKQYLLGFHTLQESDRHFSQAQRYLFRAENEGKNISQKRGVLGNASAVHINILEAMENNVPETFVWRPEKEVPVILPLQALIQEAVDQRKLSL